MMESNFREGGVLHSFWKKFEFLKEKKWTLIIIMSYTDLVLII